LIFIFHHLQEIVIKIQEGYPPNILDF